MYRECFREWCPQGCIVKAYASRVIGNIDVAFADSDLWRGDLSLQREIVSTGGGIVGAERQHASGTLRRRSIELDDESCGLTAGQCVLSKCLEQAKAGGELNRRGENQIGGAVIADGEGLGDGRTNHSTPEVHDPRVVSDVDTTLGDDGGRIGVESQVAYSFDADGVGDDVFVGVVGEFDDERVTGDGVGVTDVFPVRARGGEVIGSQFLVDQDGTPCDGSIEDGERNIGGAIGLCWPSGCDSIDAGSETAEGPSSGGVASCWIRVVEEIVLVTRAPAKPGTGRCESHIPVVDDVHHRRHRHLSLQREIEWIFIGVIGCEADLAIISSA